MCLQTSFQQSPLRCSTLARADRTAARVAAQIGNALYWIVPQVAIPAKVICRDFVKVAFGIQLFRRLQDRCKFSQDCRCGGLLIAVELQSNCDGLLVRQFNAHGAGASFQIINGSASFLEGFALSLGFIRPRGGVCESLI
ncbi:MAG: hypothetical protein ACM3IH_02435 [Sphingobacteriales bacterium]